MEGKLSCVNTKNTNWFLAQFKENYIEGIIELCCEDDVKSNWIYPIDFFLFVFDLDFEEYVWLV